MELSYVTVGVIVNTHGLRGETRVISRTEIPEERFQAGGVLKAREPKSHNRIVRDLTIVASRQHKQFWLVTFAGVDTWEDAEKLKGLELVIHVDDLPELEDGAYYIHELVGLQVRTDTGELLGTLKEVLSPGANDVYVVSRPAKKDVLIPAIRDCILGVNREQHEMTVKLMPGLIEEDE